MSNQRGESSFQVAHFRHSTWRLLFQFGFLVIYSGLRIDRDDSSCQQAATVTFCWPFTRPNFEMNVCVLFSGCVCFLLAFTMQWWALLVHWLDEAPRIWRDDIETETGGQNDGNTGQNGKEQDRMSYRNSNTKESNVEIETQMQKKRHIDTEFLFVFLPFILRYVHIRFSSFLFFSRRRTATNRKI